MCLCGQIVLLLPFFSGGLWSGDVECRSCSVGIVLESAVSICGCGLPGVYGDLEVCLQEVVLASLFEVWVAVWCGVGCSGVDVGVLLCG